MKAEAVRAPEWRDGVPANLEAAADDALAWLVALRPLAKRTAERRLPRLRAEAELARLDRCIRALREKLGKEATP